MEDPNKTPLDLPNITTPASLMKGINQLEKSQTRQSMRDLLADFGYTEDETLDFRHVPYSAMLELEGAVCILALTEDKHCRLITLLEPGAIETPDGLLTLRARYTLTPVHHYSRKIQNAITRIHAPSRRRKAYDEVFRERSKRTRDTVRDLLGRPAEKEGEKPNS